MQLDVTYTPQDLAEALAPARKPMARRFAGVIGGMILLLLVALVVLLTIMDMPAPLAIQEPAQLPSQDLLLTLIPTLAPAAMAPLILSLILLRASGPPSKGRRVLASLFASGIVVLGLAPIFLMLESETIIEWRPTRADIVFTALVPWIVSILLCITILLTWYRSFPKRQWQALPTLHRPRQMVLTPEGGMHIRDEVLEYRLSWRFFQSARETVNLLLLQGEDGRTYMIPKRHFARPEDLAAARAMIKEHVPRSVLLLTDAAFPVVIPAASLPRG